jgi:hypothetical protein
MIRVTRIETTYPAPIDGDDYCPEPESVWANDDDVTFRELVRLMREHLHPSCSPARGDTREWLTTEAEQDWRTGEYTEHSLHYSRENPPRAAKYWRAAMRAAGFAR